MKLACLHHKFSYLLLHWNSPLFWFWTDYAWLSWSLSLSFGRFPSTLRSHLWANQLPAWQIIQAIWEFHMMYKARLQFSLILCWARLNFRFWAFLLKPFANSLRTIRLGHEQDSTLFQELVLGVAQTLCHLLLSDLYFRLLSVALISWEK